MLTIIREGFMNNYKFWQIYNKNVKHEILQLLKSEKSNNILCDLHIHSNHSSDGKQSLKEIINHTTQLGFKIIALTDHDSVKVFDDLYDLIKNKELPEKAPKIITGIEQTISFKEYGTMCHILKYFINPKSRAINRDIKILDKSYFNRAKIQFNRISKNKALQEIFNEYKINVGYKEFLKYLKSKNLSLPDYAPLIEYIADKLKEKKVKTAYVYEKVLYYNSLDKCNERKEMCDARFSYLENKYKTQNIDIEDNRRFLLSILAVRGVDDSAFPNYCPTGSLSVDEYGQVSIYKQNVEGVTVFAHPNHEKLNLIKNIKNFAGGLVGLEENFKSQQQYFNELEEMAKKENLIITKGSDSHYLKDDVYTDLSFYTIPKKVIKNLVGFYRG